MTIYSTILPTTIVLLNYYLLTYFLTYLLTYLLIDQFAKQVHCQVGQTVHAVTQKRGLFHLPVCYRPVIELSYRPGQTKRRTAPAVIPSNCSQYRGISICRKPVPASPLYCGCIPKLPKPAENRGDIPSTALGQNSGSDKTVRKEVGNAPLPSHSLSFLPSPPIPSLPHPSLPLPFPDAKQPPESQLGVWGALGRKRISVYFELENCTWRQHCDLRVLKFVYRRNVKNALRKKQLNWQEVPKRRSGVQKSRGTLFRRVAAQFKHCGCRSN